MSGDHHPLAFEGAVDQLRQLILGLCNAMDAQKSKRAIGWPFCPVRTPGNLGRRSVSTVPGPPLASFCKGACPQGISASE
jgi:hypothetical protein